ncbi:MAG: ABC transporter permease [Actinomycetales bacterium]|nr:ABC transporter permease [Actinomycetales bacterium]
MTDVQTAPAPGGEETKPRRRINLGFDRFSGIYVWAVLVIIFSLWIPDLFLNWDNFKTILTFQAISTIVALGLIVPVAAGAFDLTIAGTLTVSAVFTAWALLDHRGVVFACGGALIVGVIIGLANSLVVVKFKVDSFIGTLGMSSILAAVAYMISGGGQLVLPEAGYYPFLDFARQEWFGISASVYYAGALALLIWWILEYTPGGRYLYAVGGNPVAARLAGVKVGRIIMLSFIASAVVCSFAGIVYLAQNANGAPDSGANYLLPAFSAVFLGATQIRPGRVNVLGTIVAILLLATGVTGLQLAGAPTYVTQLFNGAALIIAMALAARTARRRG